MTLNTEITNNAAKYLVAPRTKVFYRECSLSTNCK